MISRRGRRENTEGEYSGLEHEVVPDVVESLKVRLYGMCVDLAREPVCSATALTRNAGQCAATTAEEAGRLTEALCCVR